MTKMTNHAPGPRGITMKDGSTVWLNPGTSADIDKAKVAGELPDLGTPPKKVSNDEADLVAALQTENADLKKKVGELAAEIETLKKAAKPT